MQKNNITKFLVSFLILLAILNGCASRTYKQSETKKYEHDAPLIKKDWKQIGREEINKTIEMGPQPVFGEVEKSTKRKKITSQNVTNYLLIPEEYELLKQNVTFKFNNLDFKETLQLMAKVGEINILVGDEVAGAITAELIDVPWDKAFQALLDMKNYAADIDVNSNLIRVHAPEALTSQENYKSARAAAVRKKVELEESVEPIYSEIFRLYYISPTQAKQTLNELFSATAGETSYTPIQITEEITTRSIIVRGREKDLDVVDKVIREIDIRTKQVLIEAFIVEADSTFEKALGTRLGGYYNNKGRVAGGVAGSSSGSGAISTGSNAALGGSKDSLFDFAAIGATSGLGILRKTTTGVLKAEITALEVQGLGKTISNPKVFTLDNQVAIITQGQEIPYQTTSEGTTSTSFKEAALKLEVTPSIIGDGNVLLEIKVNNDTPNLATGAEEPPINKMQIITKLLIADGDIVVIGGIKKNKLANTKNQVPGMGNVPVIGNLFKGRSTTDNLDELLVFIAPRIL